MRARIPERAAIGFANRLRVLEPENPALRPTGSSLHRAGS